jgi:hypothetical protein
MASDAAEEIKQCEEARGKALVSADWKALDALVAGDVVHIHANGHIENKAQYLESVKTKLKFLKVERVSLNVRSYDEIAIATGVLHQTMANTPGRAFPIWSTPHWRRKWAASFGRLRCSIVRRPIRETWRCCTGTAPRRRNSDGSYPCCGAKYALPLP